MSNCRSIKHEKNFLIVEKEALLDPNISFKAKGLWAYCMSLPPDWQYNVQHLATISKEGERAIYSAIQELIDNGYCSRQQENKGKFGKIEYIFFETKCLKKFLPQRGFADARFADAQNVGLLSTKEETKDKKAASKQAAPEHVKLNFDKQPSPQGDAAAAFSKDLLREELKSRLSPEEFEHGWQVYESRKESESIVNPPGFVIKAGKERWPITCASGNYGANLRLLKTIEERFADLVAFGKINIGNDYIDFPGGQECCCFKASDKAFRTAVIQRFRKMGKDVERL